MKKFKLSSQLLILFTSVTVLSSLIFGYISYRNYQTVYLGLARNQVEMYLENAIDNPRDKENYLGYIIFTVYKDSTFNATVTDRIVSMNANRILGYDSERISSILEAGYLGEFIYSDTSGIFYLAMDTKTVIDANTTQYMLAIMDNTYIENLKAYTLKTEILFTFIGTFSSFAIIIFIGNTVVALWSRKTVGRIKNIQKSVNQFSKTGYENEVLVEGEDEISELATSVENLRIEIKENEKTKQEMFQNVSHDLKTPIAVIQSYAEAILDGTTDVSDTKVIIKQAEKLQGKVKMLLELNKISYINTDEDLLEDIMIKDMVTNVITNNKHRFGKIEIITNLDDTKFRGLREYFNSSIENMIDNAIRYAKTKIVIELKNGSLSFYNDGPAIEDKYILDGFKPYEKGKKGQFGIGMSIVQKTFNRFGYSLSVENIDEGVKFTIKLRE